MEKQQSVIFQRKAGCAVCPRQLAGSCYLLCCRELLRRMPCCSTLHLCAHRLSGLTTSDRATAAQAHRQAVRVYWIFPAAPAHYPLAFLACRSLYERRLADLERKRAESGARLRALREEEEQQRASRHTIVVDPLPARRRQRGAAGPQGRARQPGAGANPHRQLLSPALHAGPSAKERLLRKLGMGRTAGSGGGGSRGPAVVRHTIIRPAAPPAAGVGGAAGGRGQAGSGGWAVQRQQLAAAPSAASLRQSAVATFSGCQQRRLSSPTDTPPSVPAKRLSAPGAAHGVGEAAARYQQSPASGPHFRAVPAEAAKAVGTEQRVPASKPSALSAPGLDCLFIPKKLSPAPASRQLSPTLSHQPSPAQSPASALTAPGRWQQHCSEQRDSQQRRRVVEISGCIPAATPPRQQRAAQHLARPALLEECDIFAAADAEVQQRRQQGNAVFRRPGAAIDGGGVPPTAHKRLRGAASPPAAPPLRVLPLEEVDLFEGI